MANPEEEVDYGAEEDEEMVVEDREDQQASAQPKMRYRHGASLPSCLSTPQLPLHSSMSGYSFLSWSRVERRMPGSCCTSH